MRVRIRRHFALDLLVLVLCLAVVFPQAAAISGNTVDTGAECSLTVRASEQYPELKELPIPVRLYRVADLNRDGTVTVPEPAFESFDMTRFHSGASAGELEDFTRELADYAEKNELQAVAEQSVIGDGRFEKLSTELYLVVSGPVVMEGFDYVFLPSLITLPATTSTEDGLVSLTYDAELYLKVELEDQFGSVVIEKTLDSYQSDLGAATFVFQIEAVKDGKTVYSDVLTLCFDSPGVQQTIAEHIPAGAVVTVTEVYSGASYRVTSDSAVTVTVLPDGAEGAPVKAAFSNTYDDTQKQGTSVVNHFAYEEGGNAWRWEQMTDNKT